MNTNALQIYEKKYPWVAVPASSVKIVTEAEPVQTFTNSVSIVEGQGVTKRGYKKQSIDIQNVDDLNNSTAYIYALRNLSADLLPKEARVSICQKLAIPRVDSVNLVRNQNERISFHGAVACGNIWTCPICYLKAANKRGEIIKTYFASKLQQDYKLLFMTFTIQHHANSDLKKLRSDLSAIFRKTFQGRKVDKYTNKLGGQKLYVKFLEVTHGNAGFHPHYHVVFVHKARHAGFAALSIYAHFFKEARKLGYELSTKGIDYTNTTNEGFAAEQIASYLQKELTHLINKKAKNRYSTRSMFELLSDILKSDLLKTGETSDSIQKDIETYQKYAIGIKNACMFTKDKETGKDIKETLDSLALETLEKTDEQLANDSTDIKTILYRFAIPAWKQIFAQRLQPQIVSTYRVFGVDGINKLLIESNIENDLSRVFLRDKVYRDE